MTRFLLLFEPLSRAIASHVAVAFLLLFAAPAVAAVAQTRPQPVPVALTNVRLLSESADESRFELGFDPTATSFAPIASQPTQPSIGFALASRGPHAVQPSGMKGLVRGISFEQADTVLILRFSVRQAASLSAVQTGGRTIEITVTTGKAAGDYHDQGAAAPAAGLPAAYAPLP